MVKILNVKVENFNLLKELKNQKNKDLQECLKYVKLQEAELLLPKKDKDIVSFEIKDTNSDFANAIRRCLIGEVEVVALDFDEYTDLDTSDAFILSDFIKKQINLLRIQQDHLLDNKFEYYSNLQISLTKINKTDRIIDVKSDDLTITKDGKQIADFIGKNIVLTRLRPDSYIKIKNIKVIKGISRNDAAKFNSISNITYKIIDVDPIIETREGLEGVSSMKSNPTHFYISYSTHRNISEPKKLVISCCDILIKRLEKIFDDLKNINNKSTQYFSSLLELESNGGLKILQIKGEYYTIVNLISRYCFILTNGNIKFVTPALIHPDKEVGMIKIIHPEFCTLIQNSIKKIISELKDVKKSF